MKGFVRNILFVFLLPTLAMADNELSCQFISDKNGCESYEGCEISGLNTKTCKGCDTGTYNDGTTDDITQCKPCENKIPSGADQTDYTQKNCPWTLTCDKNEYYDSGTMKCKSCPEHYEYTGTTTVTFNGDGEPTVNGAMDACPPKTYTITYKSESGQIKDTVTFLYEESGYILKSEANSSDFCAKGKSITGWESNNESYSLGGRVSIINDTTFTAICSNNTYTCGAAKYLPAGQENCASCPAGYYCIGGSFNYSSIDQGIYECDEKFYCPADSQKQQPCPTGSTSKAGAKAITECYLTTEVTKFCDTKDNCIDFKVVFGDTTINVTNPNLAN